MYVLWPGGPPHCVALCSQRRKFLGQWGCVMCPRQTRHLASQPMWDRALYKTTHCFLRTFRNDRRTFQTARQRATAANKGRRATATAAFRLHFLLLLVCPVYSTRVNRGRSRENEHNRRSTIGGARGVLEKSVAAQNVPRDQTYTNRRHSAETTTTITTAAASPA